MQISVVLATYNRLDTLKQTLDALFNQDFPKEQYEVLVSDDGSSDGTRQYLEEVSGNAPVAFTFHFQENSGPAKARNWGIHNAKGKYVAFTDDDCIPPSNWVSRIVDAFGRYPEVVGVSGYQEADETTLDKNIYAQFEKFANMGDYMEDQQKEHTGGKDFLGGATNNVAYKREDLERVSGFDESFPFAASEDADLKERIVADGALMVHIPLKVTHKQPYGFGRLMRQAYVRGVGSRHFNVKHGLPSSSIRFFLSVSKVTVRSMKLLLSKYWYLFPLVKLYQLQFMRGVLDYPKVIKEREASK